MQWADKLTPEFVSTGGVARYLGVSVRTVQRLVQRGVLVPTMLTPGGQPRFRLADVAPALADQGMAVPSLVADIPSYRDSDLDTDVAATAFRGADIAPDSSLAELVRVDQLSNPLPVYTYRADASTGGWVLVNINDAADHHTRYRLRALLGRSACQIHATEPAILAYIAQCAEQKRTLGAVEPRIAVTDGERRVFHDTYAFVPPNLVLRYVEDVTERAQAEAGVVAQDHLFRVLTEDISALVCTVDTDGIIGYASPSSRTLLGREPDELIGTSALSAIHPADRAAALGAFPTHGGVVGTIPLLRMRHANGSWRWMELVVTDARHDPLFSGFVLTGRDVTDRVAAEQRLRASEEQYRRIVETAQEGIWQIDAHNRTVFANQRMADLLGYTRAEMQGRPLLDAIFPEDRARVLASVARVRSGQGGQGELRYRRKDGTAFWALVVTNPLVDEAGTFMGAQALVTDITAHKQMEEAQAHLAAIVSSSSDAIISTAPDTTILSWNSGAERLYGYSADEIVGHPFTVLMPPDRADEVPDILARLRRGERVSIVETLRQHKAGRSIPVALGISPIKGADGTIIGAASIAHDLRERKKAEATQAHLAAIVASASDAIMSADTNRLITSWNRGAELLYGYTADEVIGQPDNILLLPDGPDETLIVGDALLQHESLTIPDTMRRHKAGYALSISISTSLIRDTAGAVIGFAAIHRDISERKQDEERVRLSVARLQAQYMGNPVPIYTWQVVGDDWELVAINAAALTMTHGEAPKLLGRRARDLYRDRPNVLANYERCTRDQVTIRQESSGPLSSTGEHKELIVTYVFAPPDLVMIHTEDVTDRVAAEQRLRASEEQYRRIVETAQEGIWQIDAHNRTVFANQRMADLLGYTRAEMQGLHVMDVIPEYGQDRVRSAFARGLSGQTVTGDIRYRRKDGTMLWVNGTGNPLFAEDGTYIGALVMVTDISVRKEAERTQAHLAAIVTSSSDAIISTAIDTTILSWNQGAERLYGYTAAEVVGRSIDLLRGFGESGEAAIIAAALDRQESFSFPDTQRRHKDGRPVAVSINVSPIRTSTGDLFGYAAIHRDISERKRAEARLVQAAQENNLLAAALTATTSGIVLTDATQPDLPITYVNPGFETITGYRASDVTGRNCGFLQGPETNPRTIEEMEEALRAAQPFAGVIRNYRADGTLFWNDLRITPLRDETGQVTHYVGLLNDVSERVALEEALHHQALHDALTDLPNRRLLADRLEQALARAQRVCRPVALLLLDLDRFKEINDTLGHPQGDRLLRAVATCLTRLLRTSDTIARLGGDEFAIVLPDTDAEAATTIAAKICATIEEGISGGLEVVGERAERPGHVSASIGIAVSPDHGTEGPTLLRHADVAMYTAKRYQTRFTLYQPGEDPYTPDRLNLLADLRAAITQGELLLHYQPKVSLVGGMVVGVEALVRWPHPQRGLVRPDQFITLAEQTGLIWSLTDWVLGEALRQWRRWNESGREIQIAVNLSALNVQDRTLPDRISQALETFGVPAAALRLEVTETALMADQQRARDVLERLMELGVGLSIDDYGTGHSALAYLKHLPVDELKIDKSFVGEMIDHPADAAIVASTIALGHNLGLWVVAEGVETAEQQAALREMGCDVVQGYYLSKPLCVAALEGWMNDHISPPPPIATGPRLSTS